MKKISILCAVLALLVGMVFAPTVVFAKDVPADPGVGGETPQGADSDDMYNETEYVGENICSEPPVLKSIRLIGMLLMVAKFMVPLIIIVSGTMVFYKAMISDSDKDITKSAITLGKKIAIGILIFFVPAIVDAIFSLYNSFSTVESEYTKCEQCLIYPTSKC